MGQTDFHAQAAQPLQPQTTKYATALDRIGKDEYIFNSIQSCFSFVDYESEKFALNESYNEYCEKSGCVIVKGRLRMSYDFWVSLNASQFVLGTILQGYKIPFLHTPPSVFLNNNKSALDHSEFVKEAILELVKLGSVIECLDPPFITATIILIEIFEPDQSFLGFSFFKFTVLPFDLATVLSSIFTKKLKLSQ